MSWHYLPELAGESSGGTSSGGGRSAPLKSKRTRGRCFSADNGTVCSPCSRSGTTSAPSTGDPGVERWMSSLEGSHAKTSRQPGKVKASKAKEAAYGERWLALFARFNPDTSLWKTPQSSLLEGLDVFSATWPRWGMTRRGAAYQLHPSELLTVETEFGLWPTPNLPNGGRSVKRATKWTSNCTAYINGKKAQVGLEAFGRRSPTAEEWMMGWPAGWTGLPPLETDKFRRWLSAHGAP